MTGCFSDNNVRIQHSGHSPVETATTQPTSATAASPATKPAVFDHYWETRDLCTLDRRTHLRVAIVESMLAGRSGRMLDVGCGRGMVAAHFADLGWDVAAIDISPMAIEWTRKQHPRIKAGVLDIETEPIQGTHDAILCLEVLQQVRDPVAALTRLKGGLTPSGVAIVSLPNEFHLARRLSILAGRVNFGGIDDTHIKLYTPVEHRRLFDRCDFAVEAIRVQSIIPPRWLNGRPHSWCNALATRWPGLWALSVIYRLRPV